MQTFEIPASMVRHRREGRWKNLILAAALAVAVFAVYYPVHHYPFVDIDDDVYVYADVHVTGPLNWDTVQWAFSHYFADNYVPLDFISHNLDVQAFQLNAARHHDVNVIWHALNAILLFWMLTQATGYRGRSLMVAALFALHPINVENVAWIAERKTVLSTFFFLLAMVAYRWYATTSNARRMLVVCLLFILGLFAKPQVIALPFVLLLWDYWPLRRMFPRIEDPGIASEVDSLPPQKFSALLEEKLGLFAIALADALVTMDAERGMQFLKYPLYIRVGNAILSYARYIEKAFWPNHLALMYLHPGYSLSWWQVSIALIFLLAVSAFVLVNWKNAYLTVGWLWFLGTMIPTIGLVQIDLHSMADRYAYVAFVGLFIMLCWGVADWAQKHSLPRAVLPVASLAVVLALSVTTRRQVGFWSDRLTLWNHTLDVTHRNWVADVRLGTYYFVQGQDDQAMFHYSRAAQDKPNEPIINKGMAILEQKRGNLQEAITYYEKALAVSHDDQLNALLLANMGHAYSDLGDAADAMRCYRSAQRLSASTPSPAANR